MFFSVLCSRAATAAVTLRLLLFGITTGISPKSCYGECDGTEEVARALVAAGTGALLVGNTVIGRVYKKLCGSFYTDYREDAEGNENLKAVLRVYKLAVKEIEDGVRNVNAVARTYAAILSNLSSEHDGLYRFNDGNGIARVNGVKVGSGAEGAAGDRGVRGYTSLATVEDYVLFKHREALYRLASAYVNAGLKLDLNVVAYRNLIEAAVEGDLGKTNVCPKSLRTFCSYARRRCENLLSVGSEINSGILEAISITTAVKNALRIYTNGASLIAKGRARGVSVIMHCCNFS